MSVELRAGMATGVALATLVALAFEAPAADAKAGEAVYGRCAACHSLAHDRAGPRHCGLIGRRAGSVAGYDYSEAMRRSGLVWTPRTLDRFLAAPMEVVPGTSMGYAGIADPRERADLIAYLERSSRGAGCRK